MKRSIIVFLLLIAGTGVIAQNISQKSTRLTDDWQFLKQDMGGAWEAIRPVKPGSPQTVPIWDDISLPHCFNATDAVNPDVNYYQGPGWYRTLLEIENPYEHGKTLLHFEGAGQKTEVYIGLEKVGAHVGGYDEWTVDITEYIGKSENENGEIPLSIRCDNSRDLEMIPSDLSDFNVYGGLYRYLNLVYVPQSYIRQVHVETKITGKKSGEVELGIDWIGLPELDFNIQVKNNQDKVVYEMQQTANAAKVNHAFQLKNIEKWTPDNPTLYSIKIETLGKNGGQVYTDNFGFREFEFKKNGPFYLNGERLLLRGTHRHEDHAGVAAAMTEEMIRAEMQLMKDMGVNFIRLGHYQQSRIVLNLCDSLGILVWEEIPWCRGGLGGEEYKVQARRMLTNMINQHYNHPSIIIWGLGNENDWPGDFPEFDKIKIQEFMSELHELAHELDDVRKTGIRRCDFCKHIIDVYSPSIWAGWYRGKFTEYKEVSHENMLEVDRFFHMEWGGSSHAGRHDENPDRGLENVQTGQGADERAGDASLVGGSARVSKDGNWSETYMCNLFDWHLKEQLEMPWLTGAAQWAFKDFSTPVRPGNPVPYMNQKGLVARDLTPKEGYYVFQSYWTEKPMLHIYGHSWPTRWGNEGEAKMVKVYSNCAEVELFLNDKSLGVRKRNVDVYPACGLYWNVKFEKGENELVAVAAGNDCEIKDELKLEYQTEAWGTPSQLILNEIGIDEDYSWFEVKALDENGVLCLDAKNRVAFYGIGDVELIKDRGTVDGSQKVELCNGVARIKVKRLGDCYSFAVKSKGLPTVLLTSVRKKNRAN